MAQENLCYDPPFTTIQVYDDRSLKEALKNARPGDHILVQKGRYSDTYRVSISGTENKPVVIKSDPRQSYSFRGSFDVIGDHVVVEGFRLNDGRIRVYGDYNRVTRNRFRFQTQTAIEIRNGGSFNRIDHNDIGAFRPTSNSAFGVRLTILLHEKPLSNIIDHNYIHHIQGPRKNGHEAIQIGSQINANAVHTYTLIYKNLLHEVEVDGEAISIKSSSNSVIGNTLTNSDAYLSSRAGVKNRWIRNFLSRTNGLRVLGEKIDVIGNVLNSDSIWILAGDTTYSKVMPFARRNVATSKNRVAAADVNVIGNKARKIYVGHEMGRSVPVRYARIVENDALVRLHNQVGAEITDHAEDELERGRRLSPNEVGLAAVDDACRGPS